MAEEIYVTWDSMDVLLKDIFDPAGGNAATRIQEFIRGDDVTGMYVKFRLIEASGREIQFPVRLVADFKTPDEPPQQ